MTTGPEDATRPGSPSTESKHRRAGASRPPKPPWIRATLPHGDAYQRVKRLKGAHALNTVCEAAHCPNIGHCWGRGTATFMILGAVCTRNCRFCAVAGGRPDGSEGTDEPLRVARAAAAMKLRHVVITSVTRDDLPDGGASRFARSIEAVHELVPGATIEVLIPDFGGALAPLSAVIRATPTIIGHNMETVRRLYATARPQADYSRSLELLARIKRLQPQVVSKSGIMLGLGERQSEVYQVLADLRRVGCDIVTIGQYLAPSREHLAVQRYWAPDEFEALKRHALAMGFSWVESGPLVRSSYHAERQAAALVGIGD